jgi:hypothetical protein
MQYRFPTLAWLVGLAVIGCSNDNGNSDANSPTPDGSTVTDGAILDGAISIDSSASTDGLILTDAPNDVATDDGTPDGADRPPERDVGLACCPAGFLLYDCQQPGGGSGMACHNPAMGCASSMTCGQGCDPQVTGRCACAETQLCIVGDHFDGDLCKCVPNRDAAAPDAPTADARPKVDTGCIDNVLCIVGDHFDTTLCKCVPNATGCSTGADCSGPLPALCRECPDGGSGCAHHACVDGQCTIAYCP